MGKSICYNWVNLMPLTISSYEDFDYPKIRLTFNEIDRTNVDNTQILRARRIIQHPYYDPWTSENDIAIIETGMYVESPSAPYATPVCLPSIPVSGGEPGMVSGFGITEQGMMLK